VDGVIAPTESIKEELLGHAPAIRGISVIPTGVDLDRFHPNLDGSPIRSRHRLDGKKVVLHVGRVSFEKNIDTVVMSMQHLPEDTVLLVVGSGPASDHLRQLSDRLGLGDRVTFTGFVPDDDLPLYYAAADTFVLASKFETQGLVVLEAMACGLPVTGIRFRALADIIEDGVSGHLFDDGPESCAEALQRCLQEEGTLREKARERAMQFSLEGSALLLEKAYREAMEVKKGRLQGKRRKDVRY
jgi:1,2-diacylglycerol 3-alpha-glucosyltransferase